jgi:hypothetical protein
VALEAEPASGSIFSLSKLGEDRGATFSNVNEGDAGSAGRLGESMNILNDMVVDVDVK